MNKGINVKKGLLAVIAAGFLALPFAAQATNLILNGGFETGDLTDWSLSPNNCCTGVTSSEAYLGSYSFENGNENSQYTYLTQQITDAIGTNYQLSFWLLAFGDSSNGGSALTYGVQPSLLPDPSVTLTNPDTGGAWTHYTMNFSGTGTDIISFGGYDNPGYWFLDNVSVSAVTAVPEPPTLALFGLGLLGIGIMNRKRKAQKN